MFIQSYHSELRGGLRAPPRYPGVEDLSRRATLLRETHPGGATPPFRACCGQHGTAGPGITLGSGLELALP